MRLIPLPLRKEMAADPYYLGCARQLQLRDHVCGANPRTGQKIEWEHAFIFGGHQVNEKWAIIPLCWWAHSGPGLVKDINRWIAINRATEDELARYSRAVDMAQLKKYLNEKYGGTNSL